jgi:hypothetical protein
MENVFAYWGLLQRTVGTRKQQAYGICKGKSVLPGPRYFWETSFMWKKQTFFVSFM